MPGLTEAGSAEGALSDRVVAYDAAWFIALHAPYFDNVDYDTKDLYLQHSLAPGESRSFEGWLQVGPTGGLAPVVAAEIARSDEEAGSLSGTIATPDANVPDSVVMVEREGIPYAWTLTPDGSYDIDLPAGEYTIYATAAGYSRSAPQDIALEPGDDTVLDFSDLEAPGTLNFAVADAEGEPIDARIEIAEGQAPVVEFLGRQTFFTSLDDIGTAEASLAPGDYVFTVGHGTRFLGKGRRVDTARHLWTQGQRIFLSAGSDAHNVWNDDTGSARAYVHVPGELTADAFVAGLENGHAYVTRGPLIDPDVMFGGTLRAEPGTTRSLSFDLTAVNGLAAATVVGPDGEIASQSFDGETTGTARFDIDIAERETGTDRVALTVEDDDGMMAYSDPIWISPITADDIVIAD